MQIVEPTERAYVLSEKEKEILRTAAKIFDELCEGDSGTVRTYSTEYGSSVYSLIELGNISDYLNEFAYAETITERS